MWRSMQNVLAVVLSYMLAPVFLMCGFYAVCQQWRENRRMKRQYTQ